MAIARQTNSWNYITLSGFSLPAVLACIAVFLLLHQQKQKIFNPPSVRSNVIPSLSTTSDALPKTMPYDGLGPRMTTPDPVFITVKPHDIKVQRGNTLWRIAREIYGNGRDYWLIVNANRNIISKPELIHPGQHLVLPDRKAN